MASIFIFGIFVFNELSDWWAFRILRPWLLLTSLKLISNRKVGAPQKGLLCLLCCPFLSPQHTFLITSPSRPEFITKLFLHNTADWNFLNRNWNFLSYIAFSRELFRAFLHSATVDWNFLKRKPCESKLWMKIIPYSNLSSTLLSHSQITLHVFDFCQYFFQIFIERPFRWPNFNTKSKNYHIIFKYCKSESIFSLKAVIWNLNLWNWKVTTKSFSLRLLSHKLVALCQIFW